MATRAVVLQFGERKKAIKVPRNSSVSDVQFLKTEFQQWTGETAEPHFQTFDEWEEWLEVEDDFKAGNKQRIQVVLSSALTTELQRNLFWLVKIIAIFVVDIFQSYSLCYLPCFIK